MSMKQTNRLKRAGAVFCAGALVLSLFPATLAAGSGPAESSNINRQNYSRWSSPVTSYLYENESGGLTRVEYTGGQVVVENYSASFAFLDSRTIQPELPIWGGFFAGESYNFLVFGQSNAAESDSTEVIRVVKYDKNWNRLGAASLKGARTTIPFDAGSLRCDEYGDYLYIRTCHEMYTSDDGLNHQANLTMAVRQSDMTITDSFYDVMNISLGYVSHSFNQFILVDEDGKILALDHGDAYPRSAVMVGYYSNASTGKFSGSGYDWCWNMDLQTFAGSIGDNTTGASVGGLEETTNGYVMTFNYDGVGGGGDRYVYFQYMDKATGKGKQYKLNNSAGSNTPVLAPTGLEGGYLLWNDKSGDTLNYVTYDASGVPGDGVQTAAAPLSDCQPIPYGNGVVWYVTENSVPTFYTLDASGVAAHPLGATEPESTPTPSATPSATPTPTPTPTPSTTPAPTPTPTPVPNFFDDVPDAAWYADYVNLAAQAGLMKGVGNGRFNPSGIMSVAEVVTLTARLHAERNGKTVPAADGAWYQGAYTYCLQNGLFTASEVPLSTMGDSATRFQMADLMDRAVPESEKQAINSVPDGGVPDLRESDPYGDVVYRWYRAGITEGDQSGRFNGNSQISRAELATILCRLAGLTPRVGDKDLQPEPTPTPSQSVDYVAPELNFTTPVVSIYEHGTMLLTLVGADYRSISHNGITWVNESPDILTLDANRSRVTAKQVGVGYLTATKDGYTTRMTIHVVPSEDNIGMSTIGILMRPGNTATTELYVYSDTRFYGKDYTVEWSVDHPELLTLEEYTSSKGNPAVRFTTLQCGDAVITCRVTLPDGSYTEEYCCVAIRPKE